MGNLINKELEVILSDNSSYKFPVMSGYNFGSIQWGGSNYYARRQDTSSVSINTFGDNVLAPKINGVINVNALQNIPRGTKLLTLKNGGYMVYSPNSWSIGCYDVNDNSICSISFSSTTFGNDLNYDNYRDISLISLYDETEEKYRLGIVEIWTHSSSGEVIAYFTYTSSGVSDNFNTWIEGALPSSDIIGTGGGATHIAKVTGLLSTLSSNLSDILAVAGGGGGGLISDETPTTGANAGGISGSGSNSADQTTGYAFGQGESSGGGSGLYGGYKSANGNSGGAGSGYIGNALLSNKKMVGYNVPTSDVEETKTESVEVYSATPAADTPKAGNGFAKITYLRPLA